MIIGNFAVDSYYSVKSYATQPTVNPASGCQNCDHKPCGALPDWGFSVVVGLGGVLLLALLVKRR